jgi:hypothetical protein
MQFSRIEGLLTLAEAGDRIEVERIAAGECRTLKAEQCSPDVGCASSPSSRSTKMRINVIQETLVRGPRNRS